MVRRHHRPALLGDRLGNVEATKANKAAGNAVRNLLRTRQERARDQALEELGKEKAPITPKRIHDRTLDILEERIGFDRMDPADNDTREPR